MPSEKISHLLHTEPTEAPPAPPPLQAAPHSHNPYGFITDPQVAPKKKLLASGGSSKRNRLIFLATGIIVLIIFVYAALSFLNSSSGEIKADYTSLASQQVELIRIADIGVSKSKGVEARNLAATTKYTLTSQKPDVFQFAKKTGAKTDPKTLSLGKDGQTDKLLTSAAQANQFDEVFIKTLRIKLKQYQQTLKTIYDKTTVKETKVTLANNYTDVGKLIGTNSGVAE